MLVICGFKNKTEHCKFKCRHGDVHEADTGMDSCKTLEYCDIVGKKVKCRKLYKKELATLELSEGK